MYVFSVLVVNSVGPLCLGAGFKSQIYVSRIFQTMWSMNVPTMTVSAIGMNLFRRKDCDMTILVVH